MLDSALVPTRPSILRARVLLESTALAALLVAGVRVQRTDHGVDGYVLGVVLLLASSLLRDALAFVRGERSSPLALRALELAAALGLSRGATVETWVYALAGGPALARALAPGLAAGSAERPASRLEEASVLGLALAVAAGTWWSERSGLELALLLALAAEAWTPEGDDERRRAPRTAAAAHARLAAFALVGASACVRGAYPPADHLGSYLVAFAAAPSLRAALEVARRLESPPRWVSEPVSSVVRLTAAVALLHLARRGPATALAVTYMLALVVAIAHGVPHALGHPRVGRIAVRVVLLLGVGLIFQPREYAAEFYKRADLVYFLEPRTRAYYELAPPPSWQGRGRVFVYVFVVGDLEDLIAAAPLLELDGERLPLELKKGAHSLRAPLSDAALLRPTLRFAFGFAAPNPNAALCIGDYYQGSLQRSPSAWRPDGTPAPPGAPLVPRSRSWLGALVGQERFREPVLDLGTQGLRHGRFGIELWLVAPDGTVVATCE